MTILSVAYPLLCAGPDSAGGAEQVLYLLERGIVKAGHRSLVIAAAGSAIAGELLETPACSGEITEELRAEAQRAHRARIEDGLARQDVDLIHFHGLDFYNYLPETETPMLATLHLPLAWYPAEIFHLPNITLNCVSVVQAASAPGGRSLPVVCNGIDLASYRNGPAPREFLLWLGRICPEKGVHIALEVAHQLDRELIVAGPVHPFEAHERYFAECVQPLLDSKRQYVGAVGLHDKIDLLTRAQCVLIPSLAQETSSLVAMEAAACGTPVVAFASGALPEIIEHTVTGFIAGSVEEMAEYVKRIGEISPETCRERACARFDSRRMLREYLALYEGLQHAAAASFRRDSD